MGTGSGPGFGNTGGRRTDTNISIREYSKYHVEDWARRKRSTLTGKMKKNFNTACVVYDESTGKCYYGRNGGYHEKSYVKTRCSLEIALTKVFFPRNL